MKFYNLDTVFTFGKFEVNTVRQIINIQASYLDWCALNLDHFYISDEVIEGIKKINPDFKISDEGMRKLNEKYEIWENEQQVGDYDDYDDYNDYHDYERDTFDALTDGQYGDYDDWRENGGDMDSLMDGLGF